MSGPTEADATLFGFIASCMTCDAYVHCTTFVQDGFIANALVLLVVPTRGVLLRAFLC